jgi:putative acyl-CoA dehydrogenase
MLATHEVLNQSTPLVDVNLWRVNHPLRDALVALAPELATAQLDALGAEAGSAAMQAHAVEFHPSYHALLGSAMAHGLHGTPWTAGAGAHIERAAAFMLFSEAEPSVLCPVSMTYAVAPALRANAALHAAFGERLADRGYDPRPLPAARKSAITMGMGAMRSPATSGSCRHPCATRSSCSRRHPAA